MQGIMRLTMKALSWVFLVPVYFYKYAVSPLLPASCRHVPTCSQYAIEAIKIHGPLKGVWLATRRISRCHPWGTHGYDPVPPAGTVRVKNLTLKKHHFPQQRTDSGVT
jgi:putative membrane protein insertion efficiency factor